MDNVLLRTLTLKSKIGNRRYGNETVEHLIDRNKRKAICYLRWMYFSIKEITFTDDILINVLEISEEDLITKPSKVENNEYLKEKYFYKYIKSNGWEASDNLKKGISCRVNKISNKKSRNKYYNQNK